MPKWIPLTIDERGGRLENLKQLLGAYFEKVTSNHIEQIQRCPIETVNAAYAKLVSFGVKQEKISSNTQLLCQKPETLQRNFDFLNKTLKLKPEKIATHAHLLGMDPETIWENFDFLNQKLGLTPEKIASRAELLGRDSETLQRNFDFLNQTLGLTPEKIASNAHLLGRDPETLQRNFDFLNQKLGLTLRKIATNAHLIGVNPETLRGNFDFLNQKLRLTPENISLNTHLLGIPRETLQRHWQNLRRYLDADTIRCRAAALLGQSPGTIDGNAQFLADRSIGTDRYLMYYASPGLKMEKMAWIARNILGGYDRREAVSKVRAMVTRNPNVTIYPSIRRLDRTREKLQRLAARV